MFQNLTKALLAFLLFTSFSSVAQVSDSIKVEKRAATVFIHKGELLNPKKMGELMKNNAAASQEFKVAKRYYNASIFFGAAGGALVGFPLGQSASSDEPLNLKVLGTGVGLILVAIPFSINYNVRASKAVSIYNKGLSTSSSLKAEPYTFIGSSGIGIGFRF